MVDNGMHRALRYKLKRYQDEDNIDIDNIPYEKIDIDELFDRSDIYTILMYEDKAKEMLKYAKPSNFTELIKFFQVFAHGYLWELVKYHTEEYDDPINTLDDIPYSLLSVKCYFKRHNVPSDVIDRMITVYNSPTLWEYMNLKEDTDTLKKCGVPLWYLGLYYPRLEYISIEEATEIATMFLKIVWIEEYMHITPKNDTVQKKKKVITGLEYRAICKYINDRSDTPSEAHNMVKYVNYRYRVIGIRTLIDKIKNKFNKYE